MSDLADTPSRRLYSNESKDSFAKTSSKVREGATHYKINHESDRASYDIKLDLVRQQLEEKTERVAELEREVSDLESKLIEKNEKNVSLQQRINDYENTIHEKTTQGHKAGLQRAKEEIQREKDELKSAFDQEASSVLASLSSLYESVVREAENTILDIAYAVSLKLFGEVHFSKNIQYKNYIKDLVSEMVGSLSTFENMRVHVSPQDYALLVSESAADPRRSASINVACGISASSFVKDDAVEPGGCKIISIHGELDYRLSQRLNSLKEGMIKSAKHRQR